MAATSACVAVVPAHRAERTIARTIESLLGVGRPSIQRVVVVASPVDSTADIAERMGATVIRTDARLSAGAARHLGRLAAPDAERLLFVDADCAPARGAISALWMAMDADDLDAAGASVLPASETPVSWVRHALEFKDSEPGALSAWPSFVPSATLLCRAVAYDGVGGFPDLWPGEDLVLCARLARAGYRVRRLDSAITVHEHPPGVRAMLRHQYALGLTSALARRLEPMDGSVYAYHAATVPLLFVGRALRTLRWSMGKRSAEVALAIWRFPLCLAGLLAWSAGFAHTVVRAEA